MLLSDLQIRLNQARKTAGKAPAPSEKLAMGLLQVVIGELSTLKARNNKEPTEAEIVNFIRGVCGKNVETSDFLTGRDLDVKISKLKQKTVDLKDESILQEIADLELSKARRLQGHEEDIVRLANENIYLNSLLPKTLTVEEIVVGLAPLKDQLVAAKSVGQAVGMAMKFFKSGDLCVLGDDVKKAVEAIKS